MLKNYFKIALRNLNRHKGYSLINILGLALGIACCSLILLYVQDELNFDSFHENSENIYRVVETRESPDRGERHTTMTAAPVGPKLVEDFPEITNSVRFIRPGRFTVQHGNNRFYEGEYLIADPYVLQFFDFQLLQGDPENALEAPNSVVITESAAKKYFGDKNPYGEILVAGNFGDCKVTGVLADPPPNSHLTFSMLFSIRSVEANERWQAFLSSWNSDYFYTYVLAEKTHQREALFSKLDGFLESYRGAEAEGKRSIYLQPLQEIHFLSDHIEYDFNNNKSDISYIYIFSAIAFFIAIIACLNYMNLATARSMNRAKEVGMRKVVGAYRSQLIGQFLSEALVISFLSMLVAFAIIYFILPAFNELSGKAFTIDQLVSTTSILGVLAIALIAGILSGSYPALFLSKLRPVSILKGYSASKGGRLRQGMVVVQFVLSVTLIIASLVVYDQLNYIKEKRLGFNKDQLVIVDINSGDARRSFQAMKNEFAQGPGVKAVSVSSRVPGEWKDLTEITIRPTAGSNDNLITMNFIGADREFLSTFEIDLVHGKNFSGNAGSDSASVILNETAAALLGFNNPIGETVTIPDAPFQATVIGVVKDFHFRSLHEAIGPLVLGGWKNPIRVIDYFTIRIDGNNTAEALNYLQGVHESFDQGTPFEYNFLDAKLSRYYITDVRTGRMVSIATLLAIIIACLGLFGLAAFTAEQRTREVGIRKVLGATVPGIVMLLSREFTRLVAISIIIAAPLAYFLMNSWLQNFAYRTTLGISTFALAGALAIIVALLTVGFQALKAALSNPVDALKYE